MGVPAVGPPLGGVRGSDGRPLREHCTPYISYKPLSASISSNPRTSVGSGSSCPGASSRSGLSGSDLSSYASSYSNQRNIFILTPVCPPPDPVMLFGAVERSRNRNQKRNRIRRSRKQKAAMTLAPKLGGSQNIVSHTNIPVFTPPASHSSRQEDTHCVPVLHGVSCSPITSIRLKRSEEADDPRNMRSTPVKLSNSSSHSHSNSFSDPDSELESQLNLEMTGSDMPDTSIRPASPKYDENYCSYFDTLSYSASGME